MSPLGQILLLLFRALPRLALESLRATVWMARGLIGRRGGAPAAAPSLRSLPADPPPPTASMPPAPARPPVPSPPAPPPPRHVSAEPTVVAVSADPGAERGAGAEVTVDEPWTGYRELAARDLIDRLKVAPDGTLAAVMLYERSHRNRRSVVAAAERELERRNPSGG